MSLKTSTGVLLYEKVVQCYDQLLNDPDNVLECDFLLLKPNQEALQLRLECIPTQVLLEEPLAVQRICSLCSAGILARRTRANSLETLAALFYSIACVRVLPNISFVFDIVCGSENAQKFFSQLMIRCKSVICSEGVTVEQIVALFRFLLVLGSCSRNLHSNQLMKFVEKHELFLVILEFLNRYRFPSTKATEEALILIFSFMATCLHYQRYERTNPCVEWLGDCSAETMSALNIHLNQLYANATKLTTSVSSSLEPASVYIDIISGISSLFLSTPSNPIPLSSGDSNKELLRDYQWSYSMVPILFTYHFLYSHPKYALLSAGLRRPVKNEEIHDQTHHNLVVPSTDVPAISYLINFSGFLFKEPQHEEIGILQHLCLLTLRVVAEDPGSCILLHDHNIVHTISPQSSRSARTSLVCHLLEVLERFLVGSLNLDLSNIEMVNCLNLKLCMETVYRLVKFGRDSCSVYWSDSSSIHDRYVSIFKTLIRVLVKWGSATFKKLIGEVEGIPAEDTELVEPMLGVLTTDATLLMNMFSIVDLLFPTPQSSNNVYWHLAIWSGKLNALQTLIDDLLLRHEHALSSDEVTLISRVSSSISPMCQLGSKISDHTHTYVSNRWGGILKLQELSSKQKVEVIESARTTLQIPRRTESIPSFIRYAENPKESAFFNHISSICQNKLAYALADAVAYQSVARLLK